MNFNKFKQTLNYKNYSNFKKFIRYIEYVLKNFIISFFIKLNFLKKKNKPILNLGSFKDNRFINYLIFSLHKDFNFSYDEDNNAIQLFKRIGFYNFYKLTVPNKLIKNQNKFNISIDKNEKHSDIEIDLDYFKNIYDENLKKKNLIMPYYMYPRIYNHDYEKIKIKSLPDFNLRLYFSGSIHNEAYGNFKWKKNPDKFPSRIEIINAVIKEFKNEIFFIRSKNDLNSIFSSNKKIVFCLHEKMIKKQSYILNFEENFKLLSSSCFILNCPGVVMPLCHHLIEGMKVGAIPITNCENLLSPKLTNENSLQFSNLNDLMEKIHHALVMSKEEIIFKRKNVFDYYSNNLSPESFRLNFISLIKNSDKKIVCCDDDRSVEKYENF